MIVLVAVTFVWAVWAMAWGESQADIADMWRARARRLEHERDTLQDAANARGWWQS